MFPVSHLQQRMLHIQYWLNDLSMINHAQVPKTVADSQTDVNHVIKLWQI